MNDYKILFSVLLLITSSFAFSASSELESAIITSKAAKTQHFEWGTLITYFAGETAGTKDVLSAIAIINPGMEIHPPHEHSEEEYLMVLEGKGTWTLIDKDFPAEAGDIMFSKPWDLHGLKNTGTKPLKFVVFKWNNKLLADLKAK